MMGKRYLAPEHHPLLAGCELHVMVEQRIKSAYQFTTTVALKTPSGSQVLIRQNTTASLQEYSDRCMAAEREGWLLSLNDGILGDGIITEAIANGVFDPVSIPGVEVQYPEGTTFVAHIDCGETKDVDILGPFPSWEAADALAHKHIDALNEDDSFDPTDDLLTYRIVPVLPEADRG